MAEGKRYSRRSAAVHAARQHCKAIFGKSYSAYEGPDYEIHPVTQDEAIDKFPKTWWLGYAGPAYYKLRGYAKEKAGD
ncbi:hypothetical protein [Mesorhizobium sp. M8A.F.Ca.ET.021.01.1.1]|uniref:hypothetical protein n=1 Tax=Mesorhizobium sp. M8A.F.Ca.ET.021.01.1.1 TaxID=2496757 RepID=UPI000FCB73B4|nr:hypothetical protein [Mesorhizobium sp. M8A.F.Ca.ET.021.01.1.1]RUW56845.1 hypothetical protein EOA36_02275 [Mesorhizobium sp. M8A.F.Ca.ET.021.01.1.1]